jgi:hypothetical protein
MTLSRRRRSKLFCVARFLFDQLVGGGAVGHEL